MTSTCRKKNYNLSIIHGRLPEVFKKNKKIKEHSDTVKTSIVTLFNEGYSYRKISNKTGISYSTVGYITLVEIDLTTNTFFNILHLLLNIKK